MARSTLLASSALVAALLSAILVGSGAPKSATAGPGSGPSIAASPAGVSRGGPSSLQGGMRAEGGALVASTVSARSTGLTASRTSPTASTASAARTHSLAVGFAAMATMAGLCVYSLLRRLRSHKRAG